MLHERGLEAPFSLKADDLAAGLEVDPAIGLDVQDVGRRRARYGMNELRRHRTVSVLSIFAHQFNSIIIWLLALAAAFSFYLGDLVEALAIVVVLLINGAIGFFTELRAARSMEALRHFAEVHTRVRREGEARMVDARDLVPGDIVLLEAGDVVTADLRLCQASALLADESVLTGESTPVAKVTDALDARTDLADRRNMAFKGTAVTRGAGEGIVVATGMSTELGRISGLVETAEAKVTPLQERLDRLGQRLVWLTLALAAITVGAGLFWGHDAADLIKTAVALAIAAVPEGLPVVATLCLARGMWRMAERNALISNLPSVETLGATTLILTDKTGTLTENRMTVVRYILDGRDVGPDELAGEPLPDDDRLKWALRLGVLCNNASLGEREDGNKAAGTGDPMEIALLAAAQKTGLLRKTLLESFAEVREHAFDPAMKMMATVHTEDGKFLFAVKGAPEAVIERCRTVLGKEDVRELSDAGRAEWTARGDEAARSGLRLLALAMKREGDADSDPYEGLTLVGMACLLDPVRADVPAAIRACQEAGVRVVMMTGDHADTAARVAQDAGLGEGTLDVLEGRDLSGLAIETATGADRDRVLSADVFARVAPETKLRLVTFYQMNGEIVAMTGDGVNDAPALKKADIGIAMGQRGTQVAREAADMILLDDAFGTIVAAMQQGRVIFDNIRKFVVYLMSCNVSEILVVGLAVGVGLPVPLLPLQILFLNLVTDVFPAFALGLWRGDDKAMAEPPRDPEEGIVDRHHWVLIGALGGLMTVLTLGAFASALFWLSLGPEQSITVAFLTLALAQLWNVFNVRATGSDLLRNEITQNPYVWAALAVCLLLITASLWLAPLSALLGLPNPGIGGLALAFGLSWVQLILGQIVRVFALRRL